MELNHWVTAPRSSDHLFLKHDVLSMIFLQWSMDHPSYEMRNWKYDV